MMELGPEELKALREHAVRVGTLDRWSAVALDYIEQFAAQARAEHEELVSLRAEVALYRAGSNLTRGPE